MRAHAPSEIVRDDEHDVRPAVVSGHGAGEIDSVSPASVFRARVCVAASRVLGAVKIRAVSSQQSLSVHRQPFRQMSGN